MLFKALGIKGAKLGSNNKQAIALSVSELVHPREFMAAVLHIRVLAKVGRHPSVGA